MTTKTICREGQNYVSPLVEVIDLTLEGVLCASGAFGINDWEDDGDSLGF